MIANAVFVSSLLCLALMMYALSELTFLAPYRAVILHAYGRQLGLFCSLLFVNLFALLYMLNRSLFLKDTGQKLAHIEKQIRSGSTISEEHSSQLER